MTTLRISILKAKALKDGRHKIRIAICHKQDTQYIVTRFTVDSLSQFKNGQVTGRCDAAVVNSKLRSMLNEYQERIDAIKNIGMYTCKQVKNMILTDNSCIQEDCTFQSVSNSYIKELQKDKRYNYAELIERNSRYFTEYSKGDIFLCDITPKMIEGYADFLRHKGTMGETTIGMHMSRTKTIINRGIKQGLVKYDLHPFINYKIKQSAVREVDISLDSFNKIRLSDFNEKKYRVAKDLFCLSFYLCGINLTDLLDINFKNTNIIEYTRRKCMATMSVKQTVRFSIPMQARKIIDEWMNKKTGKLDFGYKLSYRNFYRYLTRNLNIIAVKLGIQEKVVYYSARKSFAQYASELGIPDSVIDYCLGHSDKNRGIIRYYTKVRQKQADAAISRVIDYVEHPDRYRDCIEMNTNIMMMRL